MSEHDDSLRKALEENARLRSEREESLREVASNEYSGRVRFAERVYWAYAIPSVALGVASINFFSRSYDLKTLIGSAVVMLVLYETTVLMKLWFATARMKMDVLKEMKLLRLEVARLGTAVGVEQPSQPPVKYEPMSGVSPWERKFWLVACVLAAIGVSSWTANAWKLGGGDRATDTVVTLAADGSAEERTETSKPYSSYYKPSGLTHYAPKDQNHRFLDQMGQELPAEVVVTGAQARRDVTYTKSVFVDGMMRYTRISDIPGAAELKEGVWVYQDAMRTGGSEQEYVRTVLLPPRAKFLSAEPTADVEVDEDGRTQVRFEGMTVDDKQHMFTVRYELPSEDEREE